MAKAKQAAKAVEQAERRVQRALRAVENIGRSRNLTDEQTRKIVSTLAASVEKVKSALSAKGQAADVFKL